MFSKLFLLISAFCLTAGSALADATEVHAVGVYEGNIRTGDRIHGSEVRVVVDRGETPVILGVGSYEPVRWFITTQPGTTLQTVYLFGYQPERSEVYVNDVQVTPTVLADLGAPYQIEGERFRALVNRLTDETGQPVLASFHGSYRATEEPFVVDAVVDAPENTRDPLALVVEEGAIPAPFRAILAPDYRPEGASVVFDNDGFVLTGADGTIQRIPVTLDVPEPSWPSGAALDPVGGRIFGATSGGEGFIYQYVIAEDQWSVLSSMNNVDATGVLFDAPGNQLIFGLGRIGAGVISYDLGTGAFRDIPVAVDGLPGYTDLYDVGNGPRPELLPLAVEGENLLLKAVREDRRWQPEGTPEVSRSYVINLRTGTARLVAYADSPVSEP